MSPSTTNTEQSQQAAPSESFESRPHEPWTIDDNGYTILLY